MEVFTEENMNSRLLRGDVGYFLSYEPTF